MSEQTRDNLATAIAAHFADETEGAILTGWVIHASGSVLDEPGTQGLRWMFDYPNDQSAVETLGQIRALTIRYESGFINGTDDD